MSEKKPFFRMNFGAVKLALMLIVIFGALAVIGLDIAILAGAIATSVPEVAWVSLAASALVAVAALVVLVSSGYRFDDECMYVLLGIFKDEIPYEKITGLKRNADSGIYYVVMGEGEDGTSARIDIPRAKDEDFVKELRKHLPTIPVETFILPKKKDKN